MKAGPATLAEGTIVHQRLLPASVAFRYPVHQMWIDPDDPDELCARHWLWSSHRKAPVRFRRRDYGTDPDGSLGDAARLELTPVLGYRPDGPVRLLTQFRRWGWLFNPISIYVVWHTDDDVPVGVVLEVSNTPWKERHRYPLALEPSATGFVTSFPKELHVSPFLDMNLRYDLRLADRDDRFSVDIDVIRPGSNTAFLHTALRATRTAPSTRALNRATFRHAHSTRQVSAGIHVQALRLWRRGVPFVPHPRRVPIALPRPWPLLRWNRPAPR